MGRFGKCCCEPVCCLTGDELLTRFTGVSISGPVTATSLFFDSGSDCCNTVSHVLASPPTDRICQKVYGAGFTESATVQQRIIKHKKVFGGTYTVDVPPSTTAGCPLGLTQPEESAASLCDDVRDCGKTERTLTTYGTHHIVLEGGLREIVVSIYEARVTCPGENPACKIVVQVSQRHNYAYALAFNGVLTRTTVRTTQSPCCEITPIGAEGIADGGQYDYHPSCDWPDLDEGEPFDCDGDHNFGGSADYWITRYKFYDTLADVPATVTITDSDKSTCIFEQQCGEGDDLCFSSANTPPNYGPPQTLQTIGYMKNCRFCFDYSFDCEDCQNFNDYWSTDLWRYEGKGAKFGGITEDGLMDTFRVLNGYEGQWAGNFFMETCHRFLPLFYLAPGPTEEQIAADVNGCHWWDCVDCVFTGDDPAVPPYAPAVPDVTAYSFNSYVDEDGESEVCVPFVTVTLNFLTEGGPA